MNAAWGEMVVAALLLASGAAALAAALGLWGLRDFFLRMHAPALASTLGTWLAALATVVHFSVHEASLSLRAWVVVVLMSITAPVTAMLLARAALFRARHAGDTAVPPPLRGGR